VKRILHYYKKMCTCNEFTINRTVVQCKLKLGFRFYYQILLKRTHKLNIVKFVEPLTKYIMTWDCLHLKKTNISEKHMTILIGDILCLCVCFVCLETGLLNFLGRENTDATYTVGYLILAHYNVCIISMYSVINNGDK
jgi:hypothetical protein